MGCTRLPLYGLPCTFPHEFVVGLFVLANNVCVSINIVIDSQKKKKDKHCYQLLKKINIVRASPRDGLFVLFNPNLDILAKHRAPTAFLSGHLKYNGCYPVLLAC